MINLSMAEPENMLRPRITVVGVGGAGGNAINNMIRSSLEGCDFVAANTDAQALAQSLASRKVQLGVGMSRGLGAGSKPNIGCAAAEESLADIISILEGSDMLFVTAGMGGGTGTGAAPVIARAARESGILTVGVVTKPFHFEGNQRMRQAEAGIAELQKYVDTLIVIPNQNLFRIANERTTFAEAFRMADEVLHSGVRGITDLMVMPGFMNLDFADVKTVMGEMGKAMMGTGEADGDNRAIRAAEAAISNPLLDDISMKGARGVLINITGGLDMTLFEVDQAANRIRDEVDPDAQIKVGSTLGEGLDGRIRVSVIATGIDVELDERAAAARSSSAGGGQQTRTSLQASTVTSVKGAVRASSSEVQHSAMASSKMANSAASAAKSSSVSESSSSVVSAKPSGPATSYFTMPAAVSPKIPGRSSSYLSTPIDSVQVEQEGVMERDESIQKQATSTHRDVQPDVTIVETQELASSRDDYAPHEETWTEPQTVARTIAPRSSMSSVPVREILPVQQAQRQRTAAAGTRADNATSPDMRVTQLTTATNAPAGAGLSVNQRAQSLFQRITGFGMVRPSVVKEMEDELDLEDDSDLRVEAAATGTSDRSGLSSGESDLLDIPAFLRRQSNH
ncbi:MAG: cell division protein FtsZ [Alphaproteobacteria bacterium]|nr:cell division protein FtsZ [Alphaproteobacteria bacterium]